MATGGAGADGCSLGLLHPYARYWHLEPLLAALATTSFGKQTIGLPDPCKAFRMKKVVEGWTRDTGKCHDTRMPVLPVLLQQLVGVLPSMLFAIQSYTVSSSFSNHMGGGHCMWEK